MRISKRRRGPEFRAQTDPSTFMAALNGAEEGNRVGLVGQDVTGQAVVVWLAREEAQKLWKLFNEPGAADIRGER
jgi:hypothetical protein